MAEDLRTGCTSAPSVDDTLGTAPAVVALTTEFRWLQARTAEALLDMDERHRLIGACAQTADPAVLEWVAANLDAGPGQRIVDVRAGLGGASSWIAARTGADVVALDVIESSAAGLARLFPGIPAAAADPTALPLRDGSIDHAMAIGVLTESAEIEALATSAARVLRPGGRFVGVFHASDTLDVLGGRVPRTGALLSAFHDAGFDDVMLDSLGDLRPPPSHWRRVRRRVEQVVERRHADDIRFEAARAERHRFDVLRREGVMGLMGLLARRGD